MPYGSVLVVDDVETNIFVAKGLMAPYQVKFDSADSGFAAIEKIKSGNVYDVVFMDHMMPVMDGVEATGIIRSLGYDSPIVALTANAVAGQADIFLGSGFDDFISKPIDIRQLNSVLNKLIRDKQPPEVIEAARKQAATVKKQSPDDITQAVVDPRFAEVFVRDALRALAALEVISEAEDYGNEDALRTYIIEVHGMKSALASIGEADLSETASTLESAGREREIEVISSKTPAFLKSLRALAERLKPQETVAGEGADVDKPYLTKELLSIKAACGEYDEKAAEDILNELRAKPWPQPTRDLLGMIAEKLLHSDFDEIADRIDRFFSEAG
jgi:CheY-like chemotaxis protein